MQSVESVIFKALTKIVTSGMSKIPSIADLRTIIEKGSKFDQLPQGTFISQKNANGVRAEWIIPENTNSDNVIMYIHGGAWTLGWYNNHRRMVANLCKSSECRALAVDYRLAPEHPFPAALEDCVSAYRWLLSQGNNPGSIVFAGDSAGGNLVLSTMMYLRDSGIPLPVCAVCISPMIDLDGTGETFNSVDDALLRPDFAITNARLYAGEHGTRNPLVSPYYGNFSGLPPILIHAGAEEILLSDAQRLEKKAKSHGVDARLVVWPGMWHVWHTYVPFLPEAREAIEEIGSFIKLKTGRTPDGDAEYDKKA